MIKRRNKFQISILLIVCLAFNLFIPVFSTTSDCKYCDFSTMYIGEDKYEGFNRKMFNFNSKMNKYIARPIQILWSSIIPKYGIERIQNVYNNIEYPKRLASCLLQKDLEGAKSETKRFLTNTTLGLGGMFDPAKKFFKLKPVNETMDQALCKCKMKSGPYFVMPFLSSSSPRSLLGRLIEAALDPSVYLASPITSLIKFGFLINKTSYTQPLIKMIESNYADPYDISKKMYGIDNYIKTQDLDRKNLLSTDAKLMEQNIIANTENLSSIAKQIKLIQDEEAVLAGMEELAGKTVCAECDLKPDIVLTDFNPQSPVVDSMRTALFDHPDIKKTFWHELSIWNRSFDKRIKTDSVNIYPNRNNYYFRYVLQKDKTAPVAIFYPSIGEGVNSHHATVFAKIFYDLGYSVVIQGSHFQWEFAKSMQEGYYPGLPANDCENIKLVTSKILDKIQKEKGYDFSDKVLVGTSFGAMATLFVGNSEYQNKSIGISKFIAISPPIELVYAIKQVDKNSSEFDKNLPDAKNKIATTAAKVMQITKMKDEPDFEFKELPFSEEEGKIITSFIMRQKLSDLIFTIEQISKTAKSDIYKKINNMSFSDYAEKYLLADSGGNLDDLRYDTSLYSISEFLKESNDYVIYESLNDFLINKNQLEQLKRYSPNNVVCLDNGAHLGFLYRKEFLDEFKNKLRINKILAYTTE